MFKPNAGPPSTPQTSCAGVDRVGRFSPYLWLIVALSLFLNLYSIQWGLPNGIQDWANDSIAPLGPLVYAKRLLFQEPWISKYPPFHYMVLALCYAPYVLYLYFTGGLNSPTDEYPYGLESPESALPIFVLIARLTSALMGTGTVLVNYYTVRRLYNHRAGLISALLIASSYGMIYYAHNANIDMPLLFWTSLGLYSFVALLNTYATRYYLLFSLFMALAIGTKESIYALFLGFGLLLLGFHIRYELRTGTSRHVLSALCHRKLLYGLLTFVTASVLVFNLPFNWQGATEHVKIHLEKKGSVTGNVTIKRSETVVRGHTTLVGKYLRHLLHTSGLAVFLLLAVGFLYGLWRHPAPSWMLMIPLITYYLFYLRIHSTDHLRYILPAYLLLTWQAGAFASDWLRTSRVVKVLAIVAMSLILTHSVVYGFSLNLLLSRDSRYTAEQWIEQNIPKDAVIAAHGPGLWSTPFSQWYENQTHADAGSDPALEPEERR